MDKRKKPRSKKTRQRIADGQRAAWAKRAQLIIDGQAAMLALAELQKASDK